MRTYGIFVLGDGLSLELSVRVVVYRFSRVRYRWSLMQSVNVYSSSIHKILWYLRIKTRTGNASIT